MNARNLWIGALVGLGALMCAIPVLNWDMQIESYFYTVAGEGFHFAPMLSHMVKKWGHWPSNWLLIFSFVALVVYVWTHTRARGMVVGLAALSAICLVAIMSPLHNIPGMEKYTKAVGILALVGVVVLAWRHRASAVLRALLFVILLHLLVPMLAVNGVFKSLYGRPRPSNIQELGGTAIYQEWYQITPAQAKQHKSFCSGHASSGAMILALFWLSRGLPLSRRLGLLALGGVWWAVVALGRMTIGAHYLSDTVASLWLTVFFGGLLARYWLPSGFSCVRLPFRARKAV